MFRCWPRRGGPGEIRVARSKNSKSMSGYYTCTWCVVVDCRVFGFVWMFVCVIDRYIDRCIYIYIYIYKAVVVCGVWRKSDGWCE